LKPFATNCSAVAAAHFSSPPNLALKASFAFAEPTPGLTEQTATWMKR